jgi:hypothetical protein
MADLFDEISEKVARQRLSLVVTFLAVKTATHWEALYVLAHPGKDPAAALEKASLLIDAQSFGQAWGLPAVAAVAVSVVYPWVAAGVRLSPERANMWFHNVADAIGGRNVAKALATARTELETARAGVESLRGELARSLSARLDDDTEFVNADETAITLIL